MFLMGSDPEFFVLNKAGDITSAISVLPDNSKTNRKNLGCGEVFYDNVGIEMNVPPAPSAKELIENFATLFRAVSDTIRPCSLSTMTAATFPDYELLHEDAMKFGCEPEFCAYDLCIIPPPEAIEVGGFRSCGGHIHLGESEKGVGPLLITPKDKDVSERDWPRIQVVRMMDILVGLTSVVLDNDSTAASRRNLYGKAGSHRPKDYGVEYRSPGNFWLKSPRLVDLVFSLSKIAVDFVGNGDFEKKMCAKGKEAMYPQEKVRDAINRTNRDLAGTLIEDLVRPMISAKLFRSIFHLSGVRFNSFYEEWDI